MTHFSTGLPVIVNDPRMPIIQGQVSGEDNEGRLRLTIGMVRPLFLDWVRYEVRRSPLTVERYDEALGWSSGTLEMCRSPSCTRGISWS